MDATTEQPEAVSTEAPEAQEPTTTDASSETDDGNGTYQVLSQLDICFLHIHVGLSTRKQKKIDAFIDDFKVFLADYQRGAHPLPVDTEAPVSADVVIEHWPMSYTNLAVTVHTTDRLSNEQHKAFDDALYDALKANPLFKRGGWHEEGLHFEAGIVTIPLEEGAPS